MSEIDEAMQLEDCLRSMQLTHVYIGKLKDITGADPTTADGLFRLVHATARQRTEAALSTLQSWERLRALGVLPA